MDQRRILDRTGELGEVDRLLAGTAGGHGGMVLFEGPIGIGLTTVLALARARASAAGAAVRLARGSRMERGFAFGIVRQLLEEPVTAAGDEVFAGPAAAARGLLLEGAEPTGSPFALVHAIYRVVANLCERAPLALIVDDAHWLDEPSLRCLIYVARRASELPLTLIFASALDEPEASGRPLAELAAECGFAALRPAPLEPEAVATLVRQTLPDADDDLCARCHARTDGNPLLLHELLLEIDAGETSDLDELMPAAVEQLLGRRVSRLGAEAVALLRAAAITDEAADPSLAAGVSGLDPEAADEARRELVRLTMLDASGELRPPLLRDVVLRSMTPSQRSRLHLRAADLLRAQRAPLERVAAQLLETRPGEGGECYADLRGAAAQAWSRGAPEAAARLFTRALKEPAAAEDAGELLRLLGVCEGYAEHFEPATEHLHRALALMPAGSVERARAGYSLGRFLNAVGRSDEGVRRLAAALDELPAGEGELRERLLASLLGAARLEIDARSHIDARLPEVRALHGGTWTAWEPHRMATEALELLFAGEDAARARELARVALRSDALRPRHSGFLLAVHALLASGELKLAASELERGVEIARLYGSRVAIGVLRGYQARVALARGDLAYAAELVEAPLPDGHVGRPLLAAVAVEVALEQGDLQGARAAADLNGFPARHAFTLPMLAARGRLALIEGAPAEAAERFEQLGELYARWGAPGLLDIPWRSCAALAQHAAGRVDAARALVDEEVALAQRTGAGVHLGVALRAQGIVQSGPRGLQALEASCEVLDGLPARLEFARSLVALGEGMIGSRRVRDGRERLREAIVIASACGARSLVQQAVGALRSGGGRAARLHTSGVMSLTPAQRRIAELAAGGAANREIAQSLHVSEKTVESHLRRVYAKLEIKSRYQLAAQLNA